MGWIPVMIFSLVILLGYEIRYRVMSEELEKLKARLNEAEPQIQQLNQEIKLKQNIYQEHKPSG